MRRLPASTLVLIAILGLFALAALLAPWIAPHDPLRQSLLLRLRPPGTADARQGLFALGTGVRIAKLRRVGPKPFLLGIGSWVVIAGVSLAGVHLLA